MAPENSTENPPENGGTSQGLTLPEQVALHVELLRLAGVRFLPGDPARLSTMAAPPVNRPSPGGPPQRPLEASAPATGRLADMARSQQPAAPPIDPPPPIVQPKPPVRPVPAARPAPATPPPVFTPPKGGGLFTLEQVGAPLDSLPVLDSATRLEMLEQLRGEVAACKRCAPLVSERTQTVFGVGPLDAELCVVGEAPGANEDKLGEPFVGEAGQLLNKMLGACGFERSQVFICNILRCRPPGNRQPLPDEALACNPFLVRTLELVRPKFLCLMGATPTRYLLDQSTGVGVLRKRDLAWRGIPVQATYHPAYLLRYPDKKRDAWEDLLRMLDRMGRTPPKAP